MLKKSASGVLAALRGSTYRSVRLASSLAAALLGRRRVLVRRGWAGEKYGLFEHPEAIFICDPTRSVDRFCRSPKSFFPQPARKYALRDMMRSIR